MSVKELKAVIKLKDELSKPLKGIKSNMETLGKSVDSSKKKFADFNNGMKTVGKGMAATGAAITLGVGSAFVYSTKKAIEFESAFAGVKKTVTETAKTSFADIEKGLKSLSTKMPQSASDLAAIAESAGQLGIETDNIIKFTETMAMLGDTTNLSSEEAATTFARFANIVGMSQDNFDRLGSTTVALGNNLATTEQEISAMALRLAGAGSQIGLTEAQIMGFAGALSSVGIEAEAGGTAFSKVFSSIQLAVEMGGDDLKNFAKVANMSTKEFSKAFKDDAAGAIMAFIEGLDDTERLGKSTTAMLVDMGIEEIRLTDALKRASGASDVFNKSLSISTEAWKENNALANEAAQRYGTTESQIAMMKNQINNASIAIGTAFLPAIRNVAEFIGGLAEKFNQLDPNTRKIITNVGLIVLGFGLLLTIGGGLLIFIANCVTAFGALSAAGFFASGAMTFLTGTLFPIIAVIGLVVAACWLLKKAWDSNFLGIRDLTRDVMNFIKEKINSIKETFESVKQKCIEFGDSIKNTWNNIKEWLKHPIQGTVNLFKKETTSSKAKPKKKQAFGGTIQKNDTLTRLHQGERVLTKREVNQMDRGMIGTSGIVVNMNGVTVREEADIKRIAREFVREFNKGITGGIA